NASFHTSFGRILTRGRISWKKNPLSLYLSSNSCVFPVVQTNGHSNDFLVFCNPLFYTYIPVRILYFSYSSVFSFL
ncbi:Os03g0573001, partial [Oryza sativa Japonica Group]